MNKHYFRSLITIVGLFMVNALFGQTPLTQTEILTAASGTYKPKPGTKSFYVQMWGGGSGGNTGWPDGVNGYNGTGGGGGGSFAQTRVFFPDANNFLFGFNYAVGVGGGINQKGANTWFWSEGIAAFGGVTRNLDRVKANLNFDIVASYLGGHGGQSFRFFNGERWQGGGGGSARTTGDGDWGGNASNDLFNKFHGPGGNGTGRGGKTGEYNPGTPGGGGSGDQVGARGEIRVISTCDYTPGRIENPHTIPFPTEGASGIMRVITNDVAPTNSFGFIYRWDRSPNGSTDWVAITGTNQLTYTVPDTLSQTTYFRRVITNGCDPADPAKNISNVVEIRVFSQANGKKNGTISGKVVSKNGKTGVAGITITARKTINLKGSPVIFTYTTTTNGDGNYSLQNIFYGDVANGDPNSVSFIVTASKTGHDITPVSRTVTLSNTNPTANISTDFTDNTVYSITGTVTQKCPTCLLGSQGPYGVGNVEISTGNLTINPGVTDSLKADNIGVFGMTVEDPGAYTLTPKLVGRRFSPGSRNINLTADVTGVNFEDTTTYAIYGKLVDGAGLPIGSGTLQFEGGYHVTDSVLKINFKKTANISSDGSYSVQLPAGAYKVKVISFTSKFLTSDPSFIRSDSVINFFDKWAVEPIITINTKDSVRNLVYHRPPVIVLSGLTDTTCNNSTDINKQPGVVFKSNIRKYFTVSVFEGPAVLGHRVPINDEESIANPLSDYIRFFTNVENRDDAANADTLKFRLKNTANLPMLDSFFMPGAPNTVWPHKKTFEVHYIDRYGRKADAIQKNATVTGIFNPTKTYTTAFPEKPFLILHAPPGDRSYSFWSKDTTIQTITRYSVAKDNATDGYWDVSFAPTISITQGIVSFEVAGIGAIKGNKTDAKSTITGNEEVITSTSTINFQTNKSELVTGTSGDVYVGYGMNYLLGKSIFIGFDDLKPEGNCEIIESTKAIMSPEGFRTEFAYTEDHIVNVIIPQQQELADAATDKDKKAEALAQVSLWQQEIKNNNLNKKNAKFEINRSFSNGPGVGYTLTTTKTTSKTVTYDVIIANELAVELGLKVAGVGASGGSIVSFRQTTTDDTTQTNGSTITMGYHLEDATPGDYFSVDIKTDPIYGTPVFDLVAGVASCPPEEGAQKRDVPQIISGDMRFENIPYDPLDINKPFEFKIALTNKSESGEDRYYKLSVDPTTSNGLQIGVNSINDLASDGGARTYPIEYGKTEEVVIQVRKTNSIDKKLSFPNVEFYLSDNCNTVFVPNTYNTAKISFDFASTCGGIKLASPTDGWIVNGAHGNTLPITMSDFIRSDDNIVTLEYQKKRLKIKNVTPEDPWKIGFTVNQASIPTNATSFNSNWNITGLEDSVYNLRLKLVCKNGDILYSNVISGIVDKSGPILVGKPAPATEVYNPNSSEISFTYNEPIDKANLNQAGVVELIRWSNKTSVPVFVTELDGKLVITPVNSLVGNANDSFRVIVKNIADLYGNVKTRPDTSFFTLDLVPQAVYTGSNVATVQVFNPSSIAENSTGKIALHFRMKESENKVRKIYFNLTGTALYDIDYKISYDTIKKPGTVQVPCGPNNSLLCDQTFEGSYINEFVGNPGFVYIDANKTEAIIYIDPLEDLELEPNETVHVKLLSGPDYKLVESTEAIVTIVNYAPPCAPGNILYVNRNATGNKSGSSWANAMTSLKDALDFNCPTITQIWVARGTYTPTTGNDRTASFNLRNGVAMYGGFAGTETQLSQRNWRLNPTILSGDIGTPQITTDNTLILVKAANCNASTRLSGFTLTGGNANLAGSLAGGALLATNSSLVVEYCTISNNAAFEGAGMLIVGGSPLIQYCTFTGNNASWGGAIYFSTASTGSVRNSLFTANRATGQGSAILCNGGSNVSVVNCTMGGNQGSAFANFGTGISTIANSIIWNNEGVTKVYVANAIYMPLITYSIVEGGYTGTGNLNTDPRFARQVAPGSGQLGDLRLLPCSPAINVGSNAALPAGTTTDLAGFARTALTTVDMGAYERQTTGGAIVYLDAGATGNGEGTSWANAHTTLESALNDLNLCNNGNPPSLYIAAGTYVAPVEVPYTINKLNARVLGGYPKGGGTWNTALNPVIFKGNVEVLKSATIDGVRVEK
jgi:hypothetical protein